MHSDFSRNLAMLSQNTLASNGGNELSIKFFSQYKFHFATHTQTCARARSAMQSEIICITCYTYTDILNQMIESEIKREKSKITEKNINKMNFIQKQKSKINANITII